MFDIAPTEFFLVVVVALLVIGPKDLPKAMRFVGKWMGKARGMARHFRAGMDTMMREAELEELEKQWKAQNEEIMRQFPNSADLVTDKSASKPSTQGGSGAVDDGDSAANGTSDQSDFDAASQSPKPMESSENAGPHPDAETHIVPPRSSELP